MSPHIRIYIFWTHELLKLSFHILNLLYRGLILSKLHLYGSLNVIRKYTPIIYTMMSLHFQSILAMYHRNHKAILEDHHNCNFVCNYSCGKWQFSIRIHFSIFILKYYTINGKIHSLFEKETELSLFNFHFTLIHLIILLKIYAIMTRKRDYLIFIIKNCTKWMIHSNCVTFIFHITI